MGTLRLSCAVAIVLGMAAPWSAAQGGGLSTEQAASAWPRWQGRLSVGLDRADASSAGEYSAARRASLLGDYYITDPFHTGSGGLRATSGLIVSPRSMAGQPLTSSLAGRGFNVERHLDARSQPSWAESDSGTVPYVGLGYTGLVARSGFSFSADLGVMGPRVRLGSSGGQSVDDPMNELRLAPILSLGVSYAF